MLEYAGEPFEWGSLDCCHFAAKVAERITGVDYSAGFDYWSEQGAETIIERFGDLTGLVSHILNRSHVEISALDVGDPCLVRIPIQGDLLGIYNGNNAIVKMKARAYQVERKRVMWGWNIG